MAIGQYLKQGRIVGKNSSSAGHVVASLVAALALLMGCTDPGSRAAQESKLDPEPEYSDASVESRILDSKIDPGTFSEFFGNWSVVGSSCPRICAMSNEEAESWIGLTLTLTESAVVFGDYSCRAAAYQSRQVSRLDFLNNFRLDLKDLGILAEEAQELTISCEGQQWYAPGSGFFVKNSETLIAPWDGVFFELKRTPPEVD